MLNYFRTMYTVVQYFTECTVEELAWAIDKQISNKMLVTYNSTKKLKNKAVLNLNSITCIVILLCTHKYIHTDIILWISSL